ncbi:cysteine hydrolase [Sneathiella marina]|uniref:Cysteine hydrolase n=1 Tax=Sneathiella marina TaxID=2950108 RepID=A0ABY4W4H4_9PROT|nr:cysteine hydrolase family protein [Sneathiella marina]USG61724.1 cysteine hydrolase [Sneathiella marina]
MPDPKTLLSLSGANTTPCALSDAALIIIDCQQEYVDGMLPLPGVQRALSAVSGILSRARNLGSPVIHVAHKGAAGGAFDRAAANGQIVPQASPDREEIVIEKPLPNAFAGTTLADELARIGRKELIICGFMTHMCVSSTARAALDLGYRNTIIGEACATRDLPMVGGGVLDAVTLHQASLTALADRFAVIAGSQGDVPD